MQNWFSKVESGSLTMQVVYLTVVDYFHELNIKYSRITVALCRHEDSLSLINKEALTRSLYAEGCRVDPRFWIVILIGKHECDLGMAMGRGWEYVGIWYLKSTSVSSRSPWLNQGDYFELDETLLVSCFAKKNLSMRT